MPNKIRYTINSLSGLLSSAQTEIIKIASLLIIPTILTKIVGQSFNLVMASFYGTSRPVSLFIVADALPQLVANLFLFGVVGAVVIPLFVEAKEKESRENFLKFYSTVFNLAILAFAIAAIVIILLADQIMPFVLRYLIDPNEVPNESEIGLVVNMMRVLFIPQIFLGASVFISSGLNVYNRYLLPQLAPLFYNLGMLIGGVIFIPLLNKSPWAIVIGVILGSLMHLALPLKLARSLGIHIQLTIDWHSQYLQKLIRVSVPRLLAFSTEQFAAMAAKFISFSYNYAYPITQYYASSIINAIPMLFGYTFAVASFPTLASLYHQGKWSEFREVVAKTINEIVFMAIPFTITLLILRLPAVRLVYGILPGQFDRQSTYLTAWLILFMSYGVMFATVRGLVYRIFYAAQRTKIPLIVGLISMVINIAGAVFFSNYFSHFDKFSLSELTFDLNLLFSKSDGVAAIAGVGLSSSVALVFEVVVLLLIFNRRVLNLGLRKLFKDIAIKTWCGLVMGLLMFIMYKLWNGLDALPIDADPNTFTGSTTLNLLVLTTITVFTSFMVYYLLCLLCGVEELKILRRILNPLFRLGGLEIK